MAALYLYARILRDETCVRARAVSRWATGRGGGESQEVTSASIRRVQYQAGLYRTRQNGDDRKT